MKMIKRSLSFLLIICMLLCMLPQLAFAETPYRLGAYSADMLAGGGRSVAAKNGFYFLDDETTFIYYTENETTQLVLEKQAGCLNLLDGILYFTEQGDSSFSIWAYDTVHDTLCCILPDMEGTVRHMYIDNADTIWYSTSDTVWSAPVSGGTPEAVYTNQALFGFVPTPYGLVYALGSVLEYALYAGDNKLADSADSFSVDFDVDGGRIAFHSFEGNFQVSLQSAFDGQAVVSEYTGFGTVDVGQMLSEDYQPSQTEIEAQTQTAANAAANQSRALNGAQPSSSAIHGTLSAGQRNAQKRAYQMTDIKWSPKSGIVGWNNGLTYTAGTTYSGIPYGQPVYASYVPWSTDLAGFVSAVNNVSSKMYTDYSSYNKRAPYYSTDCSAFVSWALNLPSRQTTSYIASYGTLISSSSYANIQVGDFLNCAGSHVVICTDIIYNSSGTIIGIEISEATVVSATKYCCQRTWYGDGFGSNSLSYFTSKYFGNGYSLYRSNTISNVSYSHTCVSPIAGDVCSACGYGSSQKASSDVKFGIDVSSHQGTINWDLVAPQIDFAILRCGYGSDYSNQDDYQWARNVSECERLGIPYGVYLYSYATTTGNAASEAQHVLRLLQGHHPALPVFYDLEDGGTTGTCSQAQILSFATIFCNAIEDAGYLAGVYANLYWWNTYLPSAEYNQWYRWVAQYNSYCSYQGTYCMWQNSSSYVMSGISSNTVDTNYWYGDFPSSSSSNPSGSYEVIFKMPTDYGETTSQFVSAGSSIVLPGINTHHCGYTFMGWSPKALNATTELPTFYYEGQSFTPTKEKTTLRPVFKYYKDGNSVQGDIYYPACDSSYTSLASAMASVGASDTSFAYRQSYVAPENFIYNYTGTVAQNTVLLNKLKAGMLVDPAAVAGFSASYNTYPGVCHRAESEPIVPATCLTDGTKLTSCSFCGYQKTSTINALGHNYASVVTWPNCQNTGFTTYTCKRCGDSYVGDETGLGDHVLAYADLGNNTHKYYCTICNTVVATELHTFSNSICTLCNAMDPNSNFSGTYYIAAKRTNDTHYHYLTSTVSNNRLVIESSGLETLPASISSPDADKAFTLIKQQDGTYSIRADGVYDNTNYIGWKTGTSSAGNNAILVSEDAAVHATLQAFLEGHVYLSFTDTTSTPRYLSFNSTAGNLYAAWYPSQMKTLYLIPVTGALPEHTHNYTSLITTHPSCTEEGVRTYTCTICGSSYTESVAAYGHDYLSVVTEPTCTDRGYTSTTCSRCAFSEIVSNSYVAALGHDDGYVYNGNETHRHFCFRCNIVITAYEECTYVNDVCSGCQHAKATFNPGDYVRVTQAPEDWSGTYLIVNETRKIAFNGSLTTPNTSGNYNSVTINDGVIVGSQTLDSYAVTIAKVSGTDYYTIRLSNGKYMGNTGSSTGISATSTKYQNTISLDTNSNAIISNATGNNTYYFRYNSASNSNRFSFYSSSTGAAVQLYRYAVCTHTWDAGVVTTAATCTAAGIETFTCTSCGEFYTQTIAALGHSIVTDAAVAATCTTSGLTAGKHCSRCGSVTIAQQTVAATGHSYIYTDNGNQHTVTCANCDYGAFEAHSFTDNFCVCGAENTLTDPYLDPALTFYQSALSLDSAIQSQFIINVRDLSAYTDFRIDYIHVYADGRENESATLRPEVLSARFSYANIPTRSTDMCDLYEITLYGLKDGVWYYGDTIEWTVRDAAMDMLRRDTSSSTLKTLIASMLNYGAYAQIKMGYNTDDLANAAMTAEDAAFALAGPSSALTNDYLVTDSGSNLTVYGTALLVDSAIEMQFVYRGSGFAAENLEAHISYTKDGVLHEEVYDVTAMTTRIFYVSFSGLAAKDMRVVVNCEFYSKTTGQSVSPIISYSGVTYAYAKAYDEAASQADKDLANALICYVDAAKAHLG